MHLKYSLLTKFIFICCIFFLFAGSRFSDGEMALGIFRSLHAIDLFFPILLLLCISNWRYIKLSLPATTLTLWWLWLIYVAFFAHLGHFISGLAFEVQPLLISLLFAVKEFEFFVIMAFGTLTASLAPGLVLRILWMSLAALAIWIPIDMQAPSGYYLLGLPLEKGAIQVGLVYGIAALLALHLYQTKPPLKYSNRFLSLFIIISLIVGMLLSQSRTAILGFASAIGLIIVLLPLRTLFAAIIPILIIFFLAFILLTPDVFWNISSIFFARWNDVSDHAGYRYEKWLELLNYLVENPILIVFGAGFDSPNQLVLGRELGHILAVDNAFVRRLFEVGVLGSLIYFFLLLSILLNLLKLKDTRIGSALLIFFLASGITAETTQISQSAGLYFLLTGVIFGLRINKI